MEFLKKHISFKGTATRSEFWIALLVITVLRIILTFSLIDLSEVALIIMLPVSIYLLIVQLAICTKRQHARNMSGWWQLVPFLSVVVGFLPNYSEDKIAKKYGGTMESK